MQDRFQALLEYEAQLNRRDAADAAARPDSAFRALQLQAESRGELFGAAHPEIAAEVFMARVQGELRNRRKLAALVPELASAEMEAAFASGVAARIADGGEVLRRQIETRHYVMSPSPPASACRSGPELVAAHQAAVEAQRRNETPDFRRMFPQQTPPDLSPVDRFRKRAAAVFAVIQTEFGLMRLRTVSGAPDPNEAAGFQHVPVHLAAVIRSLGADLLSLRKGRPEAAAFADAVQNLAAAIVRTQEAADGQRLEAVRLLQRFTEAVVLSLSPGQRRDVIAPGSAGRDVERSVARVPALIPAWSRCAVEFTALFARPSVAR